MRSFKGDNLIKEPEEYLPDLHKLRERNKYAISWKLRLETKTNRHPETGGHPWGWYEIFPMGKIVGYWGSTRDDLKGFDFDKWNQMAAKIS
jgi:hypothetical protein